MIPAALHARQERLWRLARRIHAEIDRLDAYAVSLAAAERLGPTSRPPLTVTLVVRPEEAGAFWRSGILPNPLVARLGLVLRDACRAAGLGERTAGEREAAGMQGSLFTETTP